MELVKYYMEESVLSIDEKASVIDVAATMRDNNVGLLFVARGEKFVGVITESDLTKKVVAEDRNPLETEAGDVMSTPIVSINGDTKMVAAFFEMRKNNFRHIAVSEGKKVIGILSIKDFASYYINKYESDKSSGHG